MAREFSRLIITNMLVYLLFRLTQKQQKHVSDFNSVNLANPSWFGGT